MKGLRSLDRFAEYQVLVLRVGLGFFTRYNAFLLLISHRVNEMKPWFPFINFWWCGLYDVRTEVRETCNALQDAFSVLSLGI